jgi:hypothetical protein
MSLPTCPSCGQSVLEDNAVDCPFCGAAMDGSRGAKNTPRPKANPVANRPGARKLPPEPAAPAAPTPSSAPKPEPPKPAARPIATGRAGKPVVDEDDPFGIGAAVSSQAVQATLKPEKGRLHKVVCPMCEQIGFVPKTAVGKQVRCANEKCMVPIFTAPDPNAPAEKKPARMADAEASKPTRAAAPAKRNPLMMYGIVGAVLVVVTLVVISVLKKDVTNPDLQKPVVFDPDQFGPDPEELEKQEKEKAAKDKALAAAANPKTNVSANITRMIQLARGAQLRDEALARQMTGDSYLRMGDAEKAALEFTQMVRNDRKGAVYRIEPYLAAYWRSIAAGDDTAAKKSLEMGMADVGLIPPSGRLGTEIALGLASAMFNEGQGDQAFQAVSARKPMENNPAVQDQLQSTAWQHVASRSRDLGLAAPAVTDSLLWTDPLMTAVAANLALRQRWSQAISWSTQQKDPKVLSDCLLIVTEIAGHRKAAADVYVQIEAAIPANPATGIRIRAAVAAASGDKAKLDAVVTAMNALSAPSPSTMPTNAQLAQEELPDRSAFRDRFIAVAEVVRAAVVLQSNEAATAGMARWLDEYSSWAVPVHLVRVPSTEMANEENTFKRKLATELRITDESVLRQTFQNYRRRLDRLGENGDEARLKLLLLSARLVRSGGGSLIQQTLTANPVYRQEILVDELSSLVAAAARQSKVDIPEILNPDVSLRMGSPRNRLSQQLVPVAVVTDQVWANRDARFGECLIAIDTRAGKDLSGLRQGILIELVEACAIDVAKLDAVLAGLLSLENGIWREEGLQIAGRHFAKRSMEKACEAWLGKTKVPSMEQIALFYGLNLGLLDRPAPTASAQTPPSAPAATGGSGSTP